MLLYRNVNDGKKKIQRNSEGIKIHSYNMFFDDTLRWSLYCCAPALVMWMSQNSQHAAFWQSNGAPQGAQLLFFVPASLRSPSSFRRARVPAVQWGANKRRCVQVTVDSHSGAAASAQFPRVPGAAATVESPGVGVLEGTRFIIQHVLLHYRGWRGLAKQSVCVCALSQAPCIMKGEPPRCGLLLARLSANTPQN